MDQSQHIIAKNLQKITFSAFFFLSVFAAGVYLPESCHCQIAELPCNIAELLCNVAELLCNIAQWLCSIAKRLCNIAEPLCNIARPWRGMVTTKPHTKKSSPHAYMHPCNHTTMYLLIA
jgi:hypothetical protein